MRVSLLLPLVLVSLLPLAFSQLCSFTSVTSDNFGHLFQGVNYALSGANILQLTNLTVPSSLALQGGFVTSLSVYVASFYLQGSFRLGLYRQPHENATLTLVAQSGPLTVQGNTSLQVQSASVTPSYLPANPGALLVAVWFADANLAVATDLAQTGTPGTSTLNYTYTASGPFPSTVTNALNPFALLLYNYQVAYTLATGAQCTAAALIGAGGTVQGDPQFVGFRGQSYQVHGVDGYVYNLLSSPTLQLNARFVFLGSGRCPVVAGVAQDNCWSHPGSYLGEVGLMLKDAGGKVHRVLVQSGGYKRGFAAVEVDGQRLTVGAKGEVGTGGALSFEYAGSHEVRVQTAAFSFTFSNSDRFLNQRVELHTPVGELTSHGLLGQTHTKLAKGDIEGDVDDYTLTEGHVWGTDFRFNQFAL